MKYITRKLLRNRPGSVYVPRVEHRPHGDSLHHRCADNAMAEFRRQKEAGHAVKIVSGWLVHQRDEDGHTGVHFHIWNYDPVEDVYYDVSPEGFDEGCEYDYVMDPDVWQVPWDRAMTGAALLFPPILRYDANGWIRIALEIEQDPETLHPYKVVWLGGVEDQGQELPIDWLLDVVEQERRREPERMAV